MYSALDLQLLFIITVGLFLLCFHIWLRLPKHRDRTTVLPCSYIREEGEQEQEQEEEKEEKRSKKAAIAHVYFCCLRCRNSVSKAIYR